MASDATPALARFGLQKTSLMPREATPDEGVVGEPMGCEGFSCVVVMTIFAEVNVSSRGHAVVCRASE
jgi:hypothetical protein